MTRRTSIASIILALLITAIFMTAQPPVTQFGTPATIAGNVTVVQPTGSALNAVVGGPAAATVAASGNPVPVGIVTSGGTIQYLFSTAGNADAGNGANGLAASTYLYNGALFDRRRSADLSTYNTSQTLTVANSIGAALQEKGSRWSVVSTPAAATNASASIASEASVRHVVDCISFSATASGGAVTLAPWTFNVRDGAAGAGNIIWQYSVGGPIGVNVTGAQIVAPHTACGLNLVGTTATAMTFEFSTNAVTNLVTSASISGFNVN